MKYPIRRFQANLKREAHTTSTKRHICISIIHIQRRKHPTVDSTLTEMPEESKLVGSRSDAPVWLCYAVGLTGLGWVSASTNTKIGPLTSKVWIKYVSSGGFPPTSLTSKLITGPHFPRGRLFVEWFEIKRWKEEDLTTRQVLDLI